MKIYLSASFNNRLKMRSVRDRIWALGHNVISSWLDETIKPDFLTQHEWQRKLAEKDRAEVLAADLFIMDLEGISTGKAVELGLSLGQFHYKLVWLVGKQSHIFHYLNDAVFGDWDLCLNELEKRFKTYQLQDASK